MYQDHFEQQLWRLPQKHLVGCTSMRCIFTCQVSPWRLLLPACLLLDARVEGSEELEREMRQWLHAVRFGLPAEQFIM